MALPLNRIALSIAGLVTGLTLGVAFAARDKPAQAQSFGSAQPAVAAAAPVGAPGATDMWAIDARTNQVIYCRGSGGAPTCRTTLVPGSAQPR